MSRCEEQQRGRSRRRQASCEVSGAFAAGEKRVFFSLEALGQVGASQVEPSSTGEKKKKVRFLPLSNVDPPSFA